MPFARRISRILFGAVLALTLIPGIAGAIPRDVVLARGNVWVLKNTPYSQSRYANVDGSVIATSVANASSKGYRTDCSGFVSMCWNLRRTDGTPLNLDTAGLDSSTYSVAITKAQLLPGDLMLRAKDKTPNGSGHAVLFVRWDDPAQTKYWSYEEQGTKTGTVTNLRTYATDVTGYFRPYRYKGIDPDYSDVQLQVSGANRFETAVAAVGISFPTTTTVSVPAVVLASGATWPDALGGAALAGAFKGPLLLTDTTKLPSATRASIVRLKPKKVFVLGGEAAVGRAVESAIESMGVPVTRINGSNRYMVSSAIARAAVAQARLDKRVVDTAYLATGLNFPDALAASPVSAKTRRPILLTEKNALTESTRSVLRDLGIKKVIILGGTASVSAAVESQLKAAGISVGRIEGATRYHTAINVAHHGVALGVGMSWKSLGLASGDSFADALPGGVAQGQSGTGSVVLLTPGTKLDPNVARELDEHGDAIGFLRVFGGSSVIQLPVRAAAATILRAP